MFVSVCPGCAYKVLCTVPELAMAHVQIEKADTRKGAARRKLISFLFHCNFLVLVCLFCFWVFLCVCAVKS